MIAEVISIGTELLLGQIVDTDAAYLAQQLSGLGIDVYRRQTVGDNLERAIEALRQAAGRADLVITVGGLGPTMDDLTREAIAAAFDAPLIRDPAIVQHLLEWISSRGYAVSPTQYRQADVPTGASALPNAQGTAPGLLLETNGRMIVALPGPPNELIPLFETQVAPVLRERTSGQRSVTLSRTLRIVGVGEPAVEEICHDLMSASDPTVAPYAKVSEVHLRITSKAASSDDAAAKIAPVATEIRKRLGAAVYGEGETNLEAAVVALLADRDQTVATAESCTGGTLAGRLTSVPGASAVFHTGLVTYANSAKTQLAGVPAGLLDTHGAVSEEVACAMADGVRALAAADYGIAITGIAGPTGGTEAKPVGLVFIALATPAGTAATRIVYPGQRADIRYRATQTALDLLRRALLPV